MKIDFKEILKDNKREYGEGNAHLDLISDLYTDRTHFIFELLQNAEDARATQIAFNLYENRLEVIHDGTPFNEADVRAICNIGKGTKANDETKIGTFGIGFKSVYAHTKTPQIHSGNYAFRIEHLVRPFEIEVKPIEHEKTTRFVFPFNNEETSPEESCKKIGQRLSYLDNKTLLFLHNICKIEYTLPDSGKGKYERQEEPCPCNFAEYVRVSSRDLAETWLVFHREVTHRETQHAMKVEIAFQIEKNTDNKQFIQKLQRSPLIVYFPTVKETNLGFLIQGPYTTIPNRENIREDNAWNTTLIEETAKLLTDSFQAVKDLNLLNLSFLESLPIQIEKFPAGNFYRLLFDATKNALLHKEYLPTDDSKFISAQNAKLARGKGLISLLSNSQLQFLFQSESSLHWLKNEMGEEHYKVIGDFLVQTLGIQEIRPEIVMGKLNEKFLKQQKDDWFIELYKFIKDRPKLWSGNIGHIQLKPIIRLESGEQVVPFSPAKIPQAFLPTQNDLDLPPQNNLETELPIVMRLLCRNEDALNFLKNIGLEEPSLYNELITRLVPKYSRSSQSIVSKAEHNQDIQKIRRAIEEVNRSDYKKLIQKMLNIPILKAINNSGIIKYQKPTEIYENTHDLHQFFRNTDNVWFLHDSYTAYNFDPQFWKDLCIQDLPRIEEKNSGGNTKKDPKKIDYSMHGLCEYLKCLRNLEYFNEQQEQALILWNFLNQYLKKGKNIFESKLKYTHYNHEYEEFDKSHIYKVLHVNEWIPTKSGTLECPSNITATDIVDEFPKDPSLLKQLKFKNTHEFQYNEEEKSLAESLGLSESDCNYIKNNPAEISTFIQQQSQKPTFPEKPANEHLKERAKTRTQEAEKRKYETRERSVRTSDPEDKKLLLKTLYTNPDGAMVCQICQEEMPFRKKNGEYYFESIEIFALESEDAYQFLALCPVCAAKYHEYVKRDETAKSALKQKILKLKHNSEPYKVDISLDHPATVRFVEEHVIMLQALTRSSH